MKWYDIGVTMHPNVISIRRRVQKGDFAEGYI